VTVDDAALLPAFMPMTSEDTSHQDPGPDKVQFHKATLTKAVTLAVAALSKIYPRYVITMDQRVIDECAARACSSLDEYRMSGADKGALDGLPAVAAPNHFKEAGHYAYWLVRLKPLRLINQDMVRTALDLRHIPYDPQQLEEAFPKRKSMILLLNEYAAMFVARQIIRRAERTLFRWRMAVTDPIQVVEESREFNRLCAVVSDRLDRLTVPVARSLRYDTHSPNSLALLFECLYGTGYAFMPTGSRMMDGAGDLTADDGATT